MRVCLSSSVFGKASDGSEICVLSTEREDIDGNLYTTALCGKSLVECIFRIPQTVFSNAVESETLSVTKRNADCLSVLKKAAFSLLRTAAIPRDGGEQRKSSIFPPVLLRIINAAYSNKTVTQLPRDSENHLQSSSHGGLLVVVASSRGKI